MLFNTKIKLSDPLAPAVMEKGAVEKRIDNLEAIERKVLIGLSAYGKHNIRQIAAFANISTSWVEDILSKEEWKSEEIPCWTKAEIIARLCVESEVASRPQDRIAALSKLMEYRGLLDQQKTSNTFNQLIQSYQLPIPIQLSSKESSKEMRENNGNKSL